MTTDATFIYVFMSFVQSVCACPTRWRTIAPSLTTGRLYNKATVIREFSRHHTKKCTTSTRHAQCTHHRSCRDPVCSCRQFPCFPLPPAARVIVLFLFPKPTLLGFYTPKGSRIYFGFEIGVPCFLRVMKNYDFKYDRP
jgi:hypothetical protein